jgi:hypothetical protein
VHVCAVCMCVRGALSACGSEGGLDLTAMALGLPVTDVQARASPPGG